MGAGPIVLRSLVFDKNTIKLYTTSILVHPSSPTGGAKHDGGDTLNESDVVGIQRMLDEDRTALNRRILEHRHRLVQRVRNQLVQRAPQRAVSEESAEQFQAFARWLEGRKTLEHTYRDERHGGHSRSWAAQVTAKEVSLLRSGSLRRVLEREGEPYIESSDWVLRELETQLNRWRQLTTSSLPLWIHVQYDTLELSDSKQLALYPNGAHTLAFTVTDNGEQLA